MQGIELITNKALTLDSREVAQIIGKRHDHLIRDINNYIEVMKQNPDLGNGLTVKVEDFFIEKEYRSEDNGRKYIRYDITKKGCEMVGNKLTGEKGVLFTAAYVTKFNAMEEQLKYQKFMSLINNKMDERLEEIRDTFGSYHKIPCRTKYQISKYIKDRLGINKINGEYEMVKQRLFIIMKINKLEDIPTDETSNAMNIIDQSIDVIKKDRPYRQTSFI